ncbi:hypothetical protein BOX15_Mlig031964g1 [Macrostomum lignano]|uniref:AB hydrolase-1 domain-containing protein n=1 Tax=Macrostomum lignano TaxID=282301 RepID=A0A267F8S9_9PLAT|nr:hypothetical protein BOX15_Mlig031964g1 [Macrostomum lignano]
MEIAPWRLAIHKQSRSLTNRAASMHCAWRRLRRARNRLYISAHRSGMGRLQIALVLAAMGAILCLYLLSLSVTTMVGSLVPPGFYATAARFPGGCGDEWPPPKHIDPEVFQTIEQVISDKGFKVKSYNVTTADGYILGVQRIMPAIQRHPTPVLLVHGLLDSGFTWVSNLANQSLAYRLSEAGYDVWLGNVRGNTYSKAHVRLSPHQLEFWKFSWDQMAEFDLPAMIDAVIGETGAKQVYYVGHSQGTEIALAAWSQNRTLNSLVRAAALLAPVATVGYIESPIRLIAPLATSLADAIDFFGHGEFLPTTRLLKFLSLAVCGDALSPLCSNVIFLLCGFDCRYTNMTRLPVYISHTPAGTSAMNLVHYAQAVQHKRFQKYDYGKTENMRRYGQPTPPQYNLYNIRVPLAVYHGEKDWLADPTDFSLLLPQIKHTLARDRNVSDYNHLDFVWGYNAAKVLYDDVVNFFNTDSAKDGA